MEKIINTNSAHNIKQKRTEDMLVLKGIEDIFLKRRAFIVRMPKLGDAVVACASGGMDTITNLAILMEEFKLEVYPFFINRNQSNYKWEKKSVDFFNDFFKKKYPGLYHDYLEIELPSPPKAYKTNLRGIKNSNDNFFLRSSVAYPARNPIIALTGMEYAYSLQNKKIFPKTVFAAHMADDPVFHSALTAIRIDNLLMCQITADYNWQFISLPIEKEFGNYYGKEIFVKWAYEHKIPLEKTRSCYEKEEHHCGVCDPACVNRKAAFEKSGVKDKTVYIN